MTLPWTLSGVILRESKSRASSSHPPTSAITSGHFYIDLNQPFDNSECTCNFSPSRWKIWRLKLTELMVLLFSHIWCLFHSESLSSASNYIQSVHHLHWNLSYAVQPELITLGKCSESTWQSCCVIWKCMYSFVTFSSSSNKFLLSVRIVDCCK